MPSNPSPKKHLISLFDRQPCWMIEPLASELGYSVPSVRRFLVETGYFSSFTHNGKWYTLRSIPQFDQDGIWFFEEAIGFSRAGSLTRTIIDLTLRSPAGMSADQLGETLRCRCHSILVQLCRRGKLQRRKLGRSHVYLAVDPPTRTIQIQARTCQYVPSTPLPAEIAVLILAEFIRHPDQDSEQLATVIARRQGISVEAAQVRELFARHGLKKKTPTSALKS